MRDQKQIAEIARAIGSYMGCRCVNEIDGSDCTVNSDRCMFNDLAQYLYDEGYRKQRERISVYGFFAVCYTIGYIIGGYTNDSAV